MNVGKRRSGHAIEKKGGFVWFNVLNGKAYISGSVMFFKALPMSLQVLMAIKRLSVPPEVTVPTAFSGAL
jgi:hypothetical protein